jgi:hypothetical protein
MCVNKMDPVSFLKWLIEGRVKTLFKTPNSL